MIGSNEIFSAPV